MKQLQKQHLVDTLKEILKAVAKINEVFATSILKTVRSRKKKKINYTQLQRVVVKQNILYLQINNIIVHIGKKTNITKYNKGNQNTEEGKMNRWSPKDCPKEIKAPVSHV